MRGPTALATALLAAVSIAASDPFLQPTLNPVTRLPAPKHAPLKLVADGEPRFVVVYDRKTERERYVYGWQRVCRSAENAAEAIATNVTLATGRPVRILTDDQPVPAGMLAIYVGRSKRTEALGVRADDLPSEGFRVTTFAGGVAIVGDDTSLDPLKRQPEGGAHRGTLWGAFDFLERFFGARFYNPGPDGSVHPAVRSLVLAPCAYSDAPVFANRGAYYLNATPETASLALGVDVTREELQLYQDTVRAAKTVPFTSMHAPPPHYWVKDRPERIEKVFFRSPFGHFYYDPKNEMNCYYDVFGTSFLDELMASYKEFYSSDKPDGKLFPYHTRRFVTFGQCDGGVGLAEALNVPVVKREGLVTEENIRLGSSGFMSDVYGRFYHQLANRLKAELPGKQLVIMPYNQYVYPPTQKRFLPLPDNVEAGVCLGQMPGFFPSEKRRARAKDILHRWRQALGGRPAKEIWTYSAGNNAFFHACAGEEMGPMIRYFGEDLGRYQVFHELGMLLTALPDRRFTAYSFPHTTYLAMRAYWNPSFDAPAALDEFWTLYYGAAGGEMRRVHRLLREAYLKVAMPAGDNDPLYPAETVDGVAALLDAAEAKLAAGTPERRRFDTYAFMLRFEIGRQRKRAKALPPYENPLLPDDATTFEDKAELAGDMAVYKCHYRAWNWKNAVYNRSALLIGDRNCYGLNYLMNRPEGKTPARTFINMTAPRMRAGFGREPIDFLGLQINGVPLAKTVPGKDAFKTSVSETVSKVEMLADFDGAKVVIEGRVKKGSPLLALSIRHVKGSKPVEKGRLVLVCVPSRLHDTDKDGRRPSHAREILTAKGRFAGPTALGEPAKAVPLDADDRFVVLQDAVFDGTSDEKGFGPSYVRLPNDFSSVEKAQAVVTTSYDATVSFAFKPGFEEFRCAILQLSRRISNDDFAKEFAAYLK